MATTVIIPARNEEDTIGPVVGAFSMFPDDHFHVYVAVDRDTTDKTSQVVIDWGGIPVPMLNVRGKGQLVASTIRVLKSAGMISERIVLCDADYTNLTFDHIAKIMGPSKGMVIGVPDWPDCEVPIHVTNSWARVSGFRVVPYDLVPANAHGYLLETQLNLAAIRSRLPIRQLFMPGLKTPFQWPLSPTREAERKRDMEWGTKNGIL